MKADPYLMQAQSECIMSEQEGREIRCKKCNKLLFKAKHADCECKCSRCGEMNTIKI